MEQNAQPFFDLDTMSMLKQSSKRVANTHTADTPYPNAGIIGQWAAQSSQLNPGVDIPAQFKGAGEGPAEG